MLLDVAIEKELKNFRLQCHFQFGSEGGGVLVLFGPSGSGKSMTLKALAGINDPDAGRIVVGDRVVFDSSQGLSLKPQQRRVGYVPQNYALFPHMNVAQNIAFGLNGLGRAEEERRVKDMLALMQLEGLEKRKPRQLSGGQQQRVALARALAIEPPVLLLDEPFSSLDATIRQQLRQNLIELSRRLSIPVVFVTHDLEEAYMLADCIAVYDRGQILQYASREQVFYEPATEQVARFLGTRNLFRGTVRLIDREKRQVLVEIAGLRLWSNVKSEGHGVMQPGTRVTVVFRPERVRLVAPLSTEAELESTPNLFKGRIVRELGRGTLYSLFVRLLDTEIEFEVEVLSQTYDRLQLRQDRDWWFEIDPAVVHLIPGRKEDDGPAL